MGKYENIEDVEVAIKAINSTCGVDIHLYQYLDNFKHNFIITCINKYNVYKLEHSEDKNLKNNWTISKLESLNSVEFNFNFVESVIKEWFQNFTAEDKLTEILPQLDYSRVFKLENHQGWGTLKEKDLVKLEETKRFALKFSLVYSNFSADEEIYKLINFLNLAYGYKKIYLPSLYYTELTEIADMINEAIPEIKLKVHKTSIYITFKDSAVEEDFRNRQLESVKKWLKR